MGDLRIEIAENGFVVYEDNGLSGSKGKIWAFESPTSLAKFIKEWGE